MYQVLLIVSLITGYVAIGSFVYGCANSLVKGDEQGSFFCALFWPFVIPLYIIFGVLGSWMSNLGFYLTERRLIKLKNEKTRQRNIIKELQELENEVEKALTSLH